jgi:hypothetical protein
MHLPQKAPEEVPEWICDSSDIFLLPGSGGRRRTLPGTRMNVAFHPLPLSIHLLANLNHLGFLWFVAPSDADGN